MGLANKIALKLTGSLTAQQSLQNLILRAQFYSGIGSGAFVNTSGEEAVLRLIEKNIAGPKCIFDIGANQGEFLASIQRNLSSEGLTIHAFEPSENTFKMLEKTVRALSSEGLELNNFALGKKDYQSTLFSNESGSGLASLTQRRMKHFNIDFDLSETVSVRTLDGYCRERGLDHIHLVKVDVEGHELDVFFGAQEMFSRQAIDVVMFEFGGASIDTRVFFQDFYYFFQDYAMNLFRITPSGFLFPIEGYDDSLEQFRTMNFVATRLNLG
jgi:FkbM family methyltransferase